MCSTRRCRKTNVWLDELMVMGDLHDRHRAYSALRATLHALRDRLGVEEVAQFAAQLPMLIRGFYYEGWDPSGKPLGVRSRQEFLLMIAREIRRDASIYAEWAARSVFGLLEQRISAGEIEDIKYVLPQDLRDL